MYVHIYIGMIMRIFILAFIQYFTFVTMGHDKSDSRFRQFGVIYILTFSFLLRNAQAVIWKMTNIECELLGDSKDIIGIEVCRLKAVRRDYTEGALKINFYKLPIHKITASLQLLKRANGFKPFLYNVKFDYCKLMSNAKYPMTFERYLFDIVLKTKSVKRSTCPWNESQFGFEHFGLTPEMFRLPLPGGTYRFDIKLGLDGVDRAYGKLHVKVEE